MSDKQMVQCKLVRVRLERETTLHNTLTAWIDERGAEVGAKVELLPSGVFWTVAEVYNSMPAEVIKETQRQRRKPPPSIRDTKKDKRQHDNGGAPAGMG